MFFVVISSKIRLFDETTTKNVFIEMASLKNPWDPKDDFIYSIDSKQTKRNTIIKRSNPWKDSEGLTTQTFSFLTSLSDPPTFFFTKSNHFSLFSSV